MCAKMSPLQTQRCAARRQRLCMRRPTRPREPSTCGNAQRLRDRCAPRAYSTKLFRRGLNLFINARKKHATPIALLLYFTCRCTEFY